MSIIHCAYLQSDGSIEVMMSCWRLWIPIACRMSLFLKSCPSVKAILRCHMPHKALPDTPLQTLSPSYSPITASWAPLRAFPFTL